MNQLETLWRRPIYLPYLQAPLTSKLLEKAEAELGYKLPETLVKLLKIQNGGYIRKTLEESVHSQIYGIGDRFPSLTHVDWGDYIGYVSFELQGLIPFDGDGHWYLCLDYRAQTEQPKITYIDTESDYDEVISDSFDRYLEMLIIDSEDEFLIETTHDLEAVITKLESDLNIKFEPTDAYADGDSKYRAQWEGNWIWIYDNDVTFAYLREDENCLEEYLPLTEKSSMLYPELPKTSIFLHCYEHGVIDTLKEHGWAITCLQDIFDPESNYENDN